MCALNTNKKKKMEKKFGCKRKRTFFYLNFSSIAILINKVDDFLSTLFLELISILVNGMYF